MAGKMKVLVACEESQVVCKAFRAKGHEAYSCDILPTVGDHPEWHIQDDALNHLHDGWDMLIAHPPCTYLANSGVCHLYNKDGSVNQDRWDKMKKAAEFFRSLWCCPIEKICIENPIMHKHGKHYAGVAFAHDLPEFKQVIQPWMFGHLEQKATCLWRRNLPQLKPTNNVRGEMMKLPDNKRQRLHYMPPSPTRSRDRAVTFQGIADAMAEQWGGVVD
jgi:hypothetical protein